MAGVTMFYEPGRQTGKMAAIEYATNVRMLCEYEVGGSWLLNSWLCSLISLPGWVQSLFGRYYARKTKRKYERYLRHLEYKRRKSPVKEVAWPMDVDGHIFPAP